VVSRPAEPTSVASATPISVRPVYFTKCYFAEDRWAPDEQGRIIGIRTTGSWDDTSCTFTSRSWARAERGAAGGRQGGAAPKFAS